MKTITAFLFGVFAALSLNVLAQQFTLVPVPATTQVATVIHMTMNPNDHLVLVLNPDSVKNGTVLLDHTLGPSETFLGVATFRGTIQ